MRKSTILKIGVLIFMLLAIFSFSSCKKGDDKEHIINDSFESISITGKTADIEFIPSDTCKVVLTEKANLTYEVSVSDGELKISLNDTRKWYQRLFDFGSSKISLYLPLGEYGTLKIESSTSNTHIPKDFSFSSVEIAQSTGDVSFFASVSQDAKITTSTGDIEVKSSSLGALSLAVSTGDVSVSDTRCDGDISITVSTGNVNLSNASCKNLTSVGNTGDIDLNGVIASETFSIERSTGDVCFDSCDANEIFVTTDTGDIEGSFLTDKIIFASTDTGKVDIPKLTSGGKCELTTDTGDIKITIK